MGKDKSSSSSSSSRSGATGSGTSAETLASSRKKLIVVGTLAIGIMQLIAYACRCSSPLLHLTALFTIGLQLVVYIHASGVVFGNEMTERFYDLTGACTYIAAVLGTTYYSCTQQSIQSQQQVILKWMVILWASRLGLFLFSRIMVVGGDVRFARLKSNVYSFAIPWILQGVWVFITALPIFIINANHHKSSVDHRGELNALGYLGVVMWVVGFVTEVIADTQKMFWSLNSDNTGKFINTGLWAYSRHPNCKISCICKYISN
jgi:steroid 5-alpha reductase family enzyme